MPKNTTQPAKRQPWSLCGARTGTVGGGHGRDAREGGELLMRAAMSEEIAGVLRYLRAKDRLARGSGSPYGSVECWVHRTVEEKV